MERSFDGYGRQMGPLRLDYGPTWADLVCDQCGATWVGQIDEPCGWCADALQHAMEHQAELVLTPPDVDPRDARRQHALIAWADRLAVAVDAGIITRTMAERALHRETRRRTNAA